MVCLILNCGKSQRIRKATRSRIEFADFVAVLQDAVSNGITKEDEVLSCTDVVRRSLVQAEDGSIRFKTEGTKGKKPTLFSNSEDFKGGVQMLASVENMIIEKAKQLK